MPVQNKDGEICRPFETSSFRGRKCRIGASERGCTQDTVGMEKEERAVSPAPEAPGKTRMGSRAKKRRGRCADDTVSLETKEGAIGHAYETTIKSRTR